MNLCGFPEFESIQPGHKDIFKKYLSLYKKESCGFMFANVFSWKDILKLSVSSLDENLIIAGVQDNNPFFYEPVGDRKPLESVKAVFKHFKTPSLLSLKRINSREPLLNNIESNILNNA